MEKLPPDALLHLFHSDVQVKLNRAKDTLPELCLLSMCSSSLRNVLFPSIPKAKAAHALARAAHAELMDLATARFNTPPSTMTITCAGVYSDNVRILVDPGGPGRPHTGFVRVAASMAGGVAEWNASMSCEDTILHGMHVVVTPRTARAGVLTVRRDGSPTIEVGYIRGPRAAIERLIDTDD